jgi:hypothetical protein
MPFSVARRPALTMIALLAAGIVALGMVTEQVTMP